MLRRFQPFIDDLARRITPRVRAARSPLKTEIFDNGRHEYREIIVEMGVSRDHRVK
jgi:hypothetical protein